MSPESNLKRFYRVKQGVKSCSCGVIHGERKDAIVSILGSKQHVAYEPKEKYTSK